METKSANSHHGFHHVRNVGVNVASSQRVFSIWSHPQQKCKMCHCLSISHFVLKSWGTVIQHIFWGRVRVKNTFWDKLPLPHHSPCQYRNFNSFSQFVYILTYLCTTYLLTYLLTYDKIVSHFSFVHIDTSTVIVTSWNFNKLVHKQ